MARKPSYEDLERRLRDLEEESAKRKLEQGTPGGSESDFRTVFEIAPLGMVVVGPDLRYVDFNRAFADFVGYSREEILSMNIMDLTHPEDRGEQVRLAEKAWKGEVSTYNLQKRFVRKDGEIRWGLLTSTVFSTSGKEKFRLGIIEDITERKRVDEALKAAEERYRNLFNNAQVGLFRSRLSDGKIVACNDRFARGACFSTPEECCAHYVAAEHYLEPGEREIVLKELASKGELRDHDVEVTRNDGTRVWASFSAKLYPDDGFLEGAVVDISRRKEAEEALRRSEEQLSKTNQIMAGVLEHTHMMAVLLDREFNFIWVNRAYAVACGHDPSFFPGKNHFDLYPHEENQAIFQRVVDTGEAFFVAAKPFEFPDQPERGVTYWDWSLIPIKDAAGRVTNLVFTLAEVTERVKAEQALLASAERHRTILRTAMDGFWLGDLQGRLIEVNDAYCRMSGYSHEELFSMTFSDLEAAETTADTVAHIQKVIAQGEDRFETRHRCKDGSILELEISVQYRPTDGGRLVAFLRDITERKQAEKSLRESEERLRLAQMATNDVIWDWDIVKDAQQWNDAGAAVFGWPDIVGRPQTAAWWVERVHPEDRQRVDEGFFAVVNNPEVNHWHDEYRFLKADGSYAQVLDRGYVLRDEQGKAVRMIGAMLDITERIRAEEALRESEEKYKELYDMAPVGYHEFDAEGRITRVNRREMEMLGYAAEEMVGQFVWDFAVDKAEARANILANLAGSKQCDKGLMRNYRRKDGTALSVLIDNMIVKDREGRVTGIRSTLLDIMDRKKAEEEKEKLQTQLLQAQKMEAIGSLAGGVAHDFNNILGAIMGYAEMARLDLDEVSPARSYVDQIFKGGERARDLVKHMLAFARRSEPGLKPMKVGLVVKEVLKLLRASLPTTIEIRQDVQAGQDTILGDPTQIHQVLMNLGTNANHAMGETGGVLEVTMDEEMVESRELYPEIRPGRFMRLRVRDTGHGMSREVMERIFDPYFTTKEVGVGTGLGLAVVHGIVGEHGGAIRVVSEPGKGTTFTILFPILEREVSSELERQGEVPRGKGRILFVDDEEQLAELGRRMLAHLGYEVVTRTSSVQALEAFRAHPERFDLVITDMTMPRMAGDRLAQELLKIRPDLPIILCTGFSQRISDEKAKELGIKALVMKPLVMREIGGKVKEVMEQLHKKRIPC